ncbi:unnamed protein product [Symbiodinium natans]|uniref:Uncharacterized protein n=1 Tax=Symbiodinium natans TaxID=878477 RepID=A0A812RS44_9DINO|nr:unnamed protein product [Symbiodinium natans]
MGTGFTVGEDLSRLSKITVKTGRERTQERWVVRDEEGEEAKDPKELISEATESAPRVTSDVGTNQIRLAGPGSDTPFYETDRLGKLLQAIWGCPTASSSYTRATPWLVGLEYLS